MPSRYGRSFTKYSGLRSSSTICPRVYSFSLNGPVPTQRWRSSASGTWAGYTGEYPDASIRDRKSTRLNSSHGYISYAVFCLKKKIETIARVANAGVVRLTRDGQADHT